VSIQSRAVKQVSLQCGFEGVDRLEGADVMRQPVPLRRSSDGKSPSTELRGGPVDDEIIACRGSESLT